MRFKMSRRFLIFLMIMFWMMGGMALAQSETELFESAKILLFDRQWDQALKVLDQFLKQFPDSSHYPLAMLYKSKCLEEIKLYSRALNSYMRFLSVSLNDSLKEEAMIAIIDVHFNLYKMGDKSHADKIIQYLRHEQRTVRYYAAFKMSYIRDKKLAHKAVPVLKRIVVTEQDVELKDRAKIALMRINPEYLREVSRSEGPEAKLLHMEVYDKKLGKVTFSMVIPFMFAKLALESIPQREKSTLKKKGYDINIMLKKLMEKGELLKIDDEGTVFKIWID